MLAHVFSAFVDLRVCEPWFYFCLFFFVFFSNALTKHSCEHRVCGCVCSSRPFRLWSYPVYQHMFTELQEHARARFMKIIDTKNRCNFSSNSYWSVCLLLEHRREVCMLCVSAGAHSCAEVCFHGCLTHWNHVCLWLVLSLCSFSPVRMFFI